jgi:hypothetical protein
MTTMHELMTSAIAFLCMCMCGGIALGSACAQPTLPVGALSAAAAIYLVEDLNSPLDGLIVISTDPLERTFATMCK